jgi:Tol biopolymer transport system component
MKRAIIVLLWIVLALGLAGCGVISPATADLPATPASAKPGLPPPEVQTNNAPSSAAPNSAATNPTEMPQTAPTQPVEQSEPANPTPTLPPTVELRPLTSGGCCVQPFWSADSQRVLFIDRPTTDAPAGLWGVDLLGGVPQFAGDRLGIFSNDQQLRAFPEAGQTMVERLSDGQRWVIPSGGRAISFSTDGQQVAWTTGQGTAGSNSVPRQIWVSQVDGSQARPVHTAPGGSFAGWFPDGRLLISGRLDTPETGQALWALTLLPADGASAPILTELARGERLRGTSISPDGQWLAYLVTLSADPEENGIWLVNTLSGERRRLEFFGAYRWRDGNRLLVVPLDLGQPAHRLWQVDVESGAATPLTDAAITPFKIANGDWSVSPDGRLVAFVSASDNNIWLLTLPEN